MNYVEEIINFKPSCKQEENDKKLMLELINKYGDEILYRESELFHITSSSFTMNKTLDKVLMVHHNIYNSWSWIGGHADGEENLLSVSLREIQEESGVSKMKAERDKAISLDILTTNGHIKRGKYVSSHLHLNISYYIIADEDEELHIKPDENSGVKWIPVDELEVYVTEPDMLVIYKKILHKIKENNPLGIL